MKEEVGEEEGRVGWIRVSYNCNQSDGDDEDAILFAG